MIIYFFPFQMEENDAFLDAEVKYQKMKHKECYGVKASHKTPLSFLKPSDTLYIVAHGNISYWIRFSNWANVESRSISHSINAQTFTKELHRSQSVVLRLGDTFENPSLRTTAERNYESTWVS